jgi:ATP-dependent exoDNAse (exonuclease V) beta subunit
VTGAAGASTYIVDRTFRTAEGARWIVDYKTSSHEGADRDEFLDQQRERYRAQLERYARALAAGEVTLGLYFPLLSGWREWSQ